MAACAFGTHRDRKPNFGDDDITRLLNATSAIVALLTLSNLSSPANARVDSSDVNAVQLQVSVKIFNQKPKEGGVIVSYAYLPADEKKRPEPRLRSS